MKKKDLLILLKDHIPEILTIAGVGGEILSNALFVRATKLETGDGKKSHYIIPTAVSAGSIAAIIASNRVSNKQKESLIAGAVAVGSNFYTYRNTVKKNVDKELYSKIEKEYTESEIDKLIIEADATDELKDEETPDLQLYYFPQLHEMVQCTPNDISVALLNINQAFIYDEEATVKQFFRFIDPDICYKKPQIEAYGDKIGWISNPEDYMNGIQWVTVNMYTKTTDSGHDITYVNFMWPPMTRDEWVSFYTSINCDDERDSRYSNFMNVYEEACDADYEGDVEDFKEEITK